MLIENLKKKNNVMISSVKEKRFQSFGRIVSDYDFSELHSYMETFTQIPENGNIYIPSVLEMEQTAVFKQVQNILYGQMPIQIGYCNGRNTTYNGFEYHKGSEINIAVSDFMLVLGHVYDMENDTYRSERAEVFFVEKGTAIELYQTTLHLSPCRVCDEGFRDIVILPRGTNTPLHDNEVDFKQKDVLLLQKNKWVIAHKDREPLMKQGAHPGLLGENKELFY